MAPTECYQSSCLLAYLLCLLACLLACLLTWLPAFLPTCLPACLLAYLIACLLDSLGSCRSPKWAGSTMWVREAFIKNKHFLGDKFHKGSPSHSVTKNHRLLFGQKRPFQEMKNFNFNYRTICPSKMILRLYGFLWHGPAPEPPFCDICHKKCFFLLKTSLTHGSNSWVTNPDPGLR